MSKPTVDRPKDSTGIGNVTSDRMPINNIGMPKLEYRALGPLLYDIREDMERVVQSAEEAGVPDRVVSAAEQVIEEYDKHDKFPKTFDEALESRLTVNDVDIHPRHQNDFERKAVRVYKQLRDEVTEKGAMDIMKNIGHRKYAESELRNEGILPPKQSLPSNPSEPESPSDGGSGSDDPMFSGGKEETGSESSPDKGSSPDKASSGYGAFGVLGGIALLGWMFSKGGK